jgi:hypothetical protein
MVVEEMNILTTVFLRYDNQKIIYPNSILATKPVGNYYRSPDMGDAIDFCIHISTPVEKVAMMKERITGYVRASIFLSFLINFPSSLWNLISGNIRLYLSMYQYSSIENKYINKQFKTQNISSCLVTAAFAGTLKARMSTGSRLQWW